MFIRKTSKAHDYLPYVSAHSKHIKNNVPHILAKRIVVSCQMSRFNKPTIKRTKTLVKTMTNIQIILLTMHFTIPLYKDQHLYKLMINVCHLLPYYTIIIIIRI